MSFFNLLSMVLGLACLSLALSYGLLPAHRREWLLALPRQRWLGLALGSICLAWAAYHACIMLEGDLARFHGLVKLLVPVGIVLCFFFLDFLFARALGGFFILCANQLLHDAFVHDISGRGFYSLVCLLLGVFGMFCLGSPWTFRDSVELAAKRPLWSRVFAGVFLVIAVVFIIQPYLR